MSTTTQTITTDRLAFAFVILVWAIASAAIVCGSSAGVIDECSPGSGDWSGWEASP